MKKVKLVLVILISIFSLIIFLQNTEPVDTKILFYTFTMPRIALLVLMSLLGFVSGAILVYIYTGSKKEKLK
ncbi:MAG: hypothetical protein JXR69_06720 [Candidatus Delongbacteria bacterium]|nr:hypothetical protein [Candidatus Delongbacteria bacterium]